MAKKKDEKSGAPVQPPVRPLSDRVLLKDISEKDAERKLDSGIILPSSVKDEGTTKRGEVVAVGPGKREDGELQDVGVKVGEQVLFSWGDEMKFDGETYHLVSASNILGVVEK